MAADRGTMRRANFTPPRIRFNLVAYFFSQVLPSTVGGDAVRIWLFAREGAGWRRATYSVLLDRFIGLMALALIVIVTLPWSFALIDNPIGRTTIVVLGLGSFGGGLCFMAMGSLRSTRLGYWVPIRHLVEIATTARDLLFSWRDGAPLIGLSLTIHILTTAMAWSAAQAIAAPIGLLQILLLVTPVTLIATVPLSSAGWGLRETALVLAFSYAGLAENDGLVISVLLGLAMFTIGLIGGLAWLLGREPLNLSQAFRSAKPPANVSGY